MQCLISGLQSSCFVPLCYRHWSNVTDPPAGLNFMLTIYYFKRSLLSVRYYWIWWGWGSETQPWRQGSSHRFIHGVELMCSADPLTRWFTLHLKDTACNKTSADVSALSWLNGWCDTQCAELQQGHLMKMSKRGEKWEKTFLKLIEDLY